MMHYGKLALAATFAALCPLMGCVSIDVDMDALMQQPARAQEMDHLAPLIGTWHGETEMRMAGTDEVLKSTSTHEFTWQLGGRYLVEAMTMDMGDGKTMKARGVWTWDANKERFRTWWFDDWGGYGSGESTYCPDCRTFCFKAKSENMVMGLRTVGEGCSRFVDDNTMTWCWKERIPWTPFVVMEMCGTSTRQQ